MDKFVIALDQGTTSSRAVLFDRMGKVCGVSQQEFPQHFPQSGWVEHNPKDILSSQFSVLVDLMVSNSLSPSDIAALGITNQRETTVVWDKRTGEPVCNAIVWQCRRTAPIIEELCSSEQVKKDITAKTGLIPDAYFSASKIKWILDNVKGARQRAEAGGLLFGTIDTWLIWNLTGGEVHATDPTNASRTMLFDIHKRCWDSQLCDLFGIPISMLPEVRPSSGDFGTASADVLGGNIPICGVAGDQQSALFGQCCTKPGQAKNTYGTGCFLLMHTGTDAVASRNNLITTIAASAPGVTDTEYALEGSVFMAGALMQWLRDGLGLIDDVGATSDMARSVPDTEGVYIVPAFTGLGAPYWDPDARGAIYGLTRGTTKAHIVRACLEALAFQVHDLVRGMQDDSGIVLESLAVDGGASKNDFLMQFQSDLLRCELVRPALVETTAAGAAYLAGLSSGYWQDLSQIESMRVIDARYRPDMDDLRHAALMAGWKRCVELTRTKG